MVVFSLFWFLKEKLAVRIFDLATKHFGLCFTAKDKFSWNFLATEKKKVQSPVGAYLKKLILAPEKRDKNCLEASQA